MKMNRMKSRYMMMMGLIVGVLIVGCSTLTTAEREAKKAEKAAWVTKCLDNKHFVIDVDMMNTRRMGSKMLTSDWSLEVKGDTLVSYLPYVGVAHEPIFGEVKGLNFTAPFMSYEDRGFLKGVRTIRFRVSSGEDMLEYTLEVTENGYASIDVISRAREGISFSGQMDENVKPEKEKNK